MTPDEPHEQDPRAPHAATPGRAPSSSVDGAANTKPLDSRGFQLGDEAKAQFLAMMSHEMRTPLHAISGMVDLLDVSSPTLEQRGFLRRIRVNSDALLRLIEDILDFTSLEEGQVQIQRTEFSPAELIEDVAAGLWPRAASRGLTFEVRIDPQIPDLVLGDSNRVRQLLANLVGNALKYTQHGGVRIDLRALPSRAHMRFEVTDTGPGVAPEMREAIFERFVRGAPGTSGPVPGTGLGLAISRMLVERMQGTIGIEEPDGPGSRFFFELPLEQPGDSSAPSADLRGVDVRILAAEVHVPSELRTALEAAGAILDVNAEADAPWPGAGSRRVLVGLAEQFPARKKPAAVGPKLGRVAICLPGFPDWARLGPSGVGAAVGYPVRSARLIGAIRRVIHIDEPKTFVARVGDHDKPRVLLVEDDADSRGLLQRVLLRAGYHVDAARNGAVGLEKVGHFQYDLILTDLQMPFVDGFDLARGVRALELQEHRERLPIVALSAHALPGYAERCLAAGMDAYLTKPVDRLLLLETVAAHVDARPIVLVADDCIDARTLAATWLRDDRDLRLAHAGTGLEVLERCAQGRISLVLLDMNMPELDGYATARALRARLGADLPILALTAQSGPEAERRCLDAGCNALLTKPLSRSRLREAVEDYLGRADRASEQPVVVRVDSDLEDLVPPYLASQKVEVERLTSLAAEGRFAEVEASAHRTKGSGAAYGFEALTSLAAELEQAAMAKDGKRVAVRLADIGAHLERVVLTPSVPPTRS